MHKLLSVLISGPAGKVSHTKVWSNIAYAVATYIVLAQTYNGIITDDMLLYYMLILAGHNSMSKYLDSRPQPTQPTKEFTEV